MIQVGQCGNQIGRRFWELALIEHATAKSEPDFDLALASFFRNVDAGSGRELRIGAPISQLKARAVLVDMEESVVNSSHQSSHVWVHTTVIREQT